MNNQRKDVLTILQEEREFLESQLKNVNTAISALQNVSAVKGKPGKQDDKKPKVFKKEIFRQGISPLEAPTDYHGNLTWNDKIAYALSETGAATAETVASKIIELDGVPEDSRKNVAIRVSTLMSKLNSDGKISTTTEKEGRKNKYILINAQ